MSADRIVCAQTIGTAQDESFGHLMLAMLPRKKKKKVAQPIDNMKGTGQNVSSQKTMRARACSMTQFTRANVEKRLISEGFPLRDSLGPILAPLIEQYQGEIRSRFYPPEVVTLSMVTGVLARDNTLVGAVVRNNADRSLLNLPPASLNTAAYSDARTKLNPEILIQGSIKISAALTAQVSKDPFWEGYTPFAIDGTTLTANDTAKNQEEFPQHKNQVEGLGFPLIRLVILQSLLTGAVSDLAFGPCSGKESGEMALSREILPSLPENSLLIGDRYYPSFFTMADLLKSGKQGVFQAHASRHVDFSVGKQIGNLDHVVEWKRPAKPEWMSQEEYDKYPEIVKVREVQLSRELENGEKMVIVTTLLDNSVFTKSRLARLYKKRWKIEMALKDLKDTFGLSHLDVKTPEMIEKLIWAHVMAYNMLRWHMLNASILFEKDIDSLSVKTSARIISENRSHILSCHQSKLPNLFASLYAQITSIAVGQRPNRSEPRAVKKRPKPFKRLTIRRCDWHKNNTSNENRRKKA